MFDDDSEEPAPSPLEVAAAMFKSKSKGPAMSTDLAKPLHLPKMEVPTWYVI